MADTRQDFRFEIPASICFSIRGDTFEDAKAAAKALLAEYVEGINLDWRNDQGEDSYDARLYIDEQTVPELVDIEEFDDIDI